MSGLAILGFARVVLAGPPLVSDDPNTVGAGRVETIVAVDFLSQGRSTTAATPILDITAGIVEGLDLTVLATPAFELQAVSGTSEALELGLKWRPLNGVLRASFTPALLLSGASSVRAGGVFPVQVEWTRKVFIFGTDAGIIVDSGAPDNWRGSGFVGYSVIPSLIAYAEFWSAGLLDGSSGDVAIASGLEWGLGRFDILFAAGTGLHSWGGKRIDWTTYLGLRVSFNDLWGQQRPQP